MWRDKYNLGPDREPWAVEEDTESEPPRHQDTPLEDYEDQYEELFKVDLYMTLNRLDGEKTPVAIRFIVPDFDLGSFCEILQFNGVSYHCSLVGPEEGRDEEEES